MMSSQQRRAAQRCAEAPLVRIQTSTPNRTRLHKAGLRQTGSGSKHTGHEIRRGVAVERSNHGLRRLLPLRRRATARRENAAGPVRIASGDRHERPLDRDGALQTICKSVLKQMNYLLLWSSDPHIISLGDFSVPVHIRRCRLEAQRLSLPWRWMDICQPPMLISYFKVHGWIDTPPVVLSMYLCISP
jgi:hypothetical protein